MIPGSFKIYTRFEKLEPATRNDLDRFGFGYEGTCDPRAIYARGTNSNRIRIIKGDKADSNQSILGKDVLHEFKHEVKLKATRDNLMNLLNFAKKQ
jgi:hypothetical protein